MEQKEFRMSKPLRIYHGHEKREVIRRRLEEKTGGLGYWAAVDADKAGALVIVKDKTPEIHTEEPQNATASAK
jgi:hypothetical protein